MAEDTVIVISFYAITKHSRILNQIFIGVASMLAVFDLEMAHNEKGEVITPLEDYSSGLISYASYSMTVSIRVKHVLAILQHIYVRSSLGRQQRRSSLDRPLPVHHDRH